MLTERQKVVFVKVIKADRQGQPYRAADNGERVTLASLHRHGLLDRVAWRGIEGERDAAYEYTPHAKVRAEVQRVIEGR